jgi:hypothetical protein
MELLLLEIVGSSPWLTVPRTETGKPHGAEIDQEIAGFGFRDEVAIEGIGLCG